MKTKFYECITDEGNKIINVENIASVENINNRTVMTLNVKKENDVNVSFVVNLPWASVASAVQVLGLD